VKVYKVLVTIVALLSLRPPAAAQSSKIIQSGSSGQFFYEERLEPASPELKNVVSGTVTDTGGIHRFMADQMRKVYFGYDISIEELAEPNTYRVTFSRIKMTPALAKAVFLDGDPSNWKPLVTGWDSPTVRTMRAGDVMAIPLLTNSTTGQKVVDYVTFQEPKQQGEGFGALNSLAREFVFAKGTPRDFNAGDAELRIRGPRLSINGKLDSTSQSSALERETVAGPIIWFYTANRGRFCLSLAPQPELGFRKAGEVRGSILEFTVGSDTFRIVAGEAIAPSHAAYNLYVLHDPSWKPTYPFADVSKFTIGTADRSELMRK
jgi:hypothetical protein